MDEQDIGFCPRCGRELVRGATPTGKVCFRCPSCGGILRSIACDYFSLGLGPIVACVALGAFLGQRSRKQ